MLKQLESFSGEKGRVTAARWQHWFVLACFTLLAIEGVARLAYWLNWNEPFGRQRLEQIDLHEEVPANLVPSYLGSHMLHPYSGTTLKNPHVVANQAQTSVEENSIVVGLFGGSVALGVRTEFVRRLEEELSKNGIVKKVDLRLFAAGGMKQPQQIMQLNLALSIGVKFDAVVNVDGYNEAVLALGENHSRGIYPFYPRLWDVALEAYYQRRNPTEFRGERLREEFEEYTELSAQPLAKYSAAIGFILRILQERAENSIKAHSLEIKKARASRSLEHTGPKFGAEDQKATHKAIADHWKRSSMIMNHLKTLYGYEYFHFLQPNQYLPGQKRLTSTELADAYSKASPGYKYVPQLYPLLISKGQFMASRDFHFRDLTTVYSTIDEQVYRDTCCHVNELGNQLLASAIVDEMIKVWSTEGVLAKWQQ